MGRARYDIPAKALGLPRLALLEALLHEMCHQADAEAGTRGTCDEGRYHNEGFKVTAEHAGLVCFRDKHGWAVTRLGPWARRVLRRLRVRNHLFRPVALLRAPRRHPAKLKKWICACRYAVRVAQPRFRAKCLDCGKRFWRV